MANFLVDIRRLGFLSKLHAFSAHWKLPGVWTISNNKQSSSSSEVHTWWRSSPSLPRKSHLYRAPRDAQGVCRQGMMELSGPSWYDEQAPFVASPAALPSFCALR